MSLQTENGWFQVGADVCEWTQVPGTNVTLQIQRGWPQAILRAFAADFSAYVEPLRDADSACWTPTNSVATSNHLSGTAIDLNWNDHPMGAAYRGYTPDETAAVRDMLAFYEDTVFWGNDWNSPKDSMHFQMGYNTFGNSHTADFISRKIRADGFSTFRRDSAQSPSDPPALSKKDLYAVQVIQEGQRRGITPRGIQIALATCLVESNLTMYANARVPESMSIPHEAVGSDAYSVGLFQQQVRDTGNGWWWGDAATCMDPALSAGLFYDRLSRLDYNGPNSPGSYAQAVQDSAFPDRYDERYAEAVELYNRLSAQTGDDFLSALTDAEQREILDLLRQQAGYRRESLSQFRWPFEEAVNTCAGFAWSADGNTHVQLVEKLAVIYGDPKSIAMLLAVSRTNEPGREDDSELALRILNRVNAAGKALGEAWLAKNNVKVTA